jgi:site-specific recombinase XerD
MENTLKNSDYPRKITLRKVQDSLTLVEELPADNLEEWIAYYLRLVVVGVRSEEVSQKIALHLSRFQKFFEATYGHQHLSRSLRRDWMAWQQYMVTEGLAPATINNHLASLSAFTTWVHSLTPKLFAADDLAKGVGELGLPPLEPRSLNANQVRSLKNLCDRLERFHQLKGRRCSQLDVKLTRKERNGEIRIPV